MKQNIKSIYEKLNIKNWIKSYVLDKFLNKPNTTNTKTSKPEIIYSNIIDLTHCDTESRQKTIKKLIKQDDLFDIENIEDAPLSCSVEIEECNPFGGKKMLRVITLLNDFVYDLGYIPRSLEKELYDAIDNSDNYFTSLYLTKKNKIYYAKLSITFIKNT